MMKYFEVVENNYRKIINAIVSDISEKKNVVFLAEYATGEKMDPLSVIRVSHNEVGDHVIRTYAMRRMDGATFVITIECSSNHWGIQGNVVDASPSNESIWGDADNFI